MNESSSPKGAYTRRKQLHRHDPDRKRVHTAGNPTPGINVHRIGLACDKFFDARGFKPSISEHLQTRGVVIGVTKWTSRLKQARDSHAIASRSHQDARDGVAGDGVELDSGEGDKACEGHQEELGPPP